MVRKGSLVRARRWASSESSAKAGGSFRAVRGKPAAPCASQRHRPPQLACPAIRSRGSRRGGRRHDALRPVPQLREPPVQAGWNALEISNEMGPVVVQRDYSQLLREFVRGERLNPEQMI